MSADESGGTLVAMTTWSLRQIQQVRALRAKLEVDEAYLMRDAEAATGAAQTELFKALVHMAHPLAVELHPDDVTFVRAEPAATPWIVSFSAYWMPSTREVELLGGHLDGDVLTYRDAPNGPLMVPAPPPDLFASDVEPAHVLPSFGVRYELAGWDENRRRWVYEVRS